MRDHDWNGGWCPMYCSISDASACVTPISCLFACFFLWCSYACSLPCCHYCSFPTLLYEAFPLGIKMPGGGGLQFDKLAGRGVQDKQLFLLLYIIAHAWLAFCKVKWVLFGSCVALWNSFWCAGDTKVAWAPWACFLLREQNKITQEKHLT